jgi:hypothetical protein
MRDIFFFITSFVVVLSLLVSQTISAAVMNSTNYSIQSDSVNFGGGLSTSTSYNQESTFGEIATGGSESSTYKIKAGYQQMHVVYLAITAASDVTLSPTLDGTVAGVSNGSTAVTVTTDNAAGYELSIKASSSPALVSGGNFFADYTPAGANPDFTFSVAAADSEFGFSPEGSDIVASYKDNGSVCNSGSGDTVDSCWDALTTSNELIASKTSGTHPSGSITTLKFRAENGSSHLQSAGVYVATSTLTLIAL